MKAIVIGATGATGASLVKQLLADEQINQITVLVRRAYFTSHPKLTEIVVDFNRLDGYSDSINGDVAFSCLGTTLKDAGGKEAQWKVDYDYQYQFAEIASKNGIPVFVLLSSMGANAKSGIFYSRMKGKLENDLEKLSFTNLLIFQPGILVRPHSNRKGEKISVSLIRFLNRLGIAKRYKPIDVDSVAAAMIQKSKKAAKPVERVSLADIFQLSKK